MQDDWCLYKKRQRDMHTGRIPLHGGRVWNDVCTSHGLQATPKYKIKRYGTNSSLKPSERTWLCQHLIWDFWHLELERINFFCHQPFLVALYYADPRKRIQQASDLFSSSHFCKQIITTIDFVWYYVVQHSGHQLTRAI